MLDCLAIVANVCFANPQGIVFRYNTVISYAEVSLNMATVKVILTTDSAAPPDWRRMNRACVEEVCVHYHKHCDRGSLAVFCTFFVSQPGDKKNTEVRISAKNETSLRYAEEQMAVLTVSRWRSSPIELSQFAEESSQRAPPMCIYQGPNKNC